MSRTLLLLLAPFVLLACRTSPDVSGGAGTSVEVAPSDDAAAILDRHIEVSGGHAAYAHPFRVSRGTVAHKSLGILAQLTVHESRSGERRWHSRSEALGDRLHGSSRDAAWSCGLMSGVYLKEGEALAQALRAAPLDAAANWRESFEQVRCLPDRSIEGREVHVVELVPASGSNEIRCFAVETGLHVRTEVMRGYYGNLVPTVITYGDYREVDGALVPFLIHEDFGGIEELTMELEEVQHVEAVPLGVFDPPPSVQAVMALSTD